MPEDTSFLSQQRTIDMLMGALETEPFLANVLLHQLSDELTAHLAQLGKHPASDAAYVLALRSTLAECASLDPRRPDFRSRMRSLGTSFRQQAHLVYAEDAAE